jgi:hypothetical protein
MTTEQDNKRVSDAYRELAGETTPPALDKRILAQAAQEARSSYGLARTWVRPIAWAATIGLSFAFLLELTWFADAPVEAPAPGPAVSEERARADAEVMKAKQEQGLNRAVGEQVVVQPAAAPAAEEASLLHRAGKQARSEADPVQTRAAASYADRVDADHFCDAEARASAESWYECIRKLREQGLVEAATAELEALLRTFPDFTEPSPE